MTQIQEAIDVTEVQHRIDLTTPDVTNLFEQAPVYAKFTTIEARQATEQEPIYTVLANGTRETSNTAEPGDWIARNPGGEEYVIKEGKFGSRYQPTDQPGVYRATGIVRAFVNPTGVPVVTKAPWGEDIAGDANCMLTAVVTEDKPAEVSPTDRYIVGEQEFKDTYAPFAEVYGRPFGQKSRAEIAAQQRAAQDARISSLIHKYVTQSFERIGLAAVWPKLPSRTK